MGSNVGGIIGDLSQIFNTIHTGNGNDNVHVSKADGLAGALGMFDVNINGHHTLMTKDQLEAKKFDLGGGNDTFVVDSDVDARVTVDGGAGNDVIVGGRGNDNLSGGSGNDTILGGAGNDLIHGGTGNDYVSGGDGNDQVFGDAGNDVVEGGRGNDWMVGGDGYDVLRDNGGIFENNHYITGNPTLIQSIGMAIEGAGK